MNPEDRLAVLHFCNRLTDLDAWMWKETCASLINKEIDFNAPAKVFRDGNYYRIEAQSKDHRKIEMGYIEGGFFLGWEPPKR